MSAAQQLRESLVLDAADERLVRWLKRAITTVLVGGLLAFVVEGADRPADPSFEDEDAMPAVAGR